MKESRKNSEKDVFLGDLYDELKGRSTDELLLDSDWDAISEQLEGMSEFLGIEQKPDEFRFAAERIKIHCKIRIFEVLGNLLFRVSKGNAELAADKMYEGREVLAQMYLQELKKIEGFVSKAEKAIRESHARLKKFLKDEMPDSSDWDESVFFLGWGKSIEMPNLRYFEDKEKSPTVGAFLDDAKSKLFTSLSEELFIRLMPRQYFSKISDAILESRALSQDRVYKFPILSPYFRVSILRHFEGEMGAHILEPHSYVPAIKEIDKIAGFVFNRIKASPDYYDEEKREQIVENIVRQIQESYFLDDDLPEEVTTKKVSEFFPDWLRDTVREDLDLFLELCIEKQTIDVSLRDKKRNREICITGLYLPEGIDGRTALNKTRVSKRGIYNENVGFFITESDIWAIAETEKKEEVIDDEKEEDLYSWESYIYRPSALGQDGSFECKRVAFCDSEFENEQPIRALDVGDIDAKALARIVMNRTFHDRRVIKMIDSLIPLGVSASSILDILLHKDVLQKLYSPENRRIRIEADEVLTELIGLHTNCELSENLRDQLESFSKAAGVYLLSINEKNIIEKAEKFLERYETRKDRRKTKRKEKSFDGEGLILTANNFEEYISKDQLLTPISRLKFSEKQIVAMHSLGKPIRFVYDLLRYSSQALNKAFDPSHLNAMAATPLGPILGSKVDEFLMEELDEEAKDLKLRATSHPLTRVSIRYGRRGELTDLNDSQLIQNLLKPISDLDLGKGRATIMRRAYPNLIFVYQLINLVSVPRVFGIGEKTAEKVIEAVEGLGLKMSTMLSPTLLEKVQILAYHILVKNGDIEEDFIGDIDQYEMPTFVEAKDEVVSETKLFPLTRYLEIEATPTEEMHTPFFELSHWSRNLLTPLSSAISDYLRFNKLSGTAVGTLRKRLNRIEPCPYTVIDVLAHGEKGLLKIKGIGKSTLDIIDAVVEHACGINFSEDFGMTLDELRELKFRSEQYARGAWRLVDFAQLAEYAEEEEMLRMTHVSTLARDIRGLRDLDDEQIELLGRVYDVMGYGQDECWRTKDLVGYTLDELKGPMFKLTDAECSSIDGLLKANFLFLGMTFTEDVIEEILEYEEY